MSRDVCLVKTHGGLEIARVTTANVDECVMFLVDHLALDNVLLSLSRVMIAKRDRLESERQELAPLSYERIAWLLDSIATGGDLPC